MPEKGTLKGRVQSDIGLTGRRAETKASKRLGGRTTRASGNMDSDKGDITLPEWLIENKSTVNASMSLPHDWLSKISREALDKSRQPALALQFTDGTGSPLKFGRWMMIPEDLFEEIMAIYRERN